MQSGAPAGYTSGSAPLCCVPSGGVLSRLYGSVVSCPVALPRLLSLRLVLPLASGPDGSVPVVPIACKTVLRYGG